MQATRFAKRVLAIAGVVSAAASLALQADEPPKPAPENPVTTITGTLMDSATKKPVAGVLVSVHAVGDGSSGAVLLGPQPGKPTWMGWPAATTDANGDYLLHFTTACRRLMMLEVSVRAGKGPWNVTHLSMYSGQFESAKPLEGTGFRTFRGRVTDLDGKPIAGAKVCDSSCEMQTVTDKDGYFTDDRRTLHDDYRYVTAHGYEVGTLPLWSVGANAETSVVKLAPAVPVRGKVVDANGKPASDVEVCGGVFAQTYTITFWTVPTDAQGAFTMDITSGGNGTQWLCPMRGEEILSDWVSVNPGQRDVLLRLYATGTVVVSVADTQGKPVPKARVWSCAGTNLGAWHQADTDENGEAVLLNVPQCTTSVMLNNLNAGAEARWFEEQLNSGLKRPWAEIKVEANHTVRCALVLPPVPEKCRPLTVTGVLVDEQTGIPIPVSHLWVAAAFKEKAEKVYGGSDWAQMDGKFEVAMLAQQDGEPMERTKPINPDASAPERAGVIHLIVSTPGKPVLSADVTRDWPQGARRLDLGKVTVKRTGDVAR